MDNLIKRVRKHEVQTCPVCGGKFYIEYLYFPSNMDDDRDTFYYCPHCEAQGSCVIVHLRGNEEVSTVKA